MKSIRPGELLSFIAIAEQLNFGRAAVRLGVSPSALSHTLRGMEERLGLRLVNRTTRSVALTEAGQRLFARVRPAFRDIEDALEDLNTLRDTPSGSLRISAGYSAARLVLLPLIQRFLAAYPEVQVELVADDALTDMVAAGFDAGVRFGERIATDMVATPLSGPIRSVVVATPAFFVAHPRPRKPANLRGMPCIGQRFPSGARYHWEFERRGVSCEIEVDGPLVLNDMMLCVEAARAGIGMAFVFEGLVAPQLASGELVTALDDWCPTFPGLFLYYPSRRQLPSALRAFVDFTREARTERDAV